jgi:predicted PurR-regulated permease PerM
MRGPDEPPQGPDELQTAAAREQRALEWAAIAAIAAIAWLSLPLAAGLLLGTLTGFIVQPLYDVIARRTDRPVFASIATVLGCILVIIGAFAGFVSMFVIRAVALSRTLVAELGPGGALTARFQSLPGYLSKLGFSPDEVTEKLRDAGANLASRATAVAAALASATASSLLGLFFTALTMHLVLRNWGSMASELEVLSPLRPEYTRALLEEFRRVGRTTLLGTVVTGLAQGLFATIGFWITGVPQPLFFGIATALASLIPAVGTIIVWLPAGIFLIATGHPAGGIIELVWASALVIGACDYVIRPRLVGDEAVPALVTFIALFGGVEVFGLGGLIVGPVLMSLAIATLRIYEREREVGPHSARPRKRRR